MFKFLRKKRFIIIIVLLLIISSFGIYKFLTRNDYHKYLGHGFNYMNGYSTTDFKGYHVYDDAKLFHLDHQPSLMIENEKDMPVLDGAEACYPVYSAVAKTIYKDIGEIEKEAKKTADEDSDIIYYNGKKVTFSNTVMAYERLVEGSVDMVFAARPSQSQKDLASTLKEEIKTTPIGKEAFVFFVEKNNPVDNLTSEQLRAIYHGDITNWKEVGGKDQEIVAFQRPEDSGSQVMMKYFMGDVSLKEPKKVEYVGGMGEVVSEVAQYHNEKGALGYTFKYFLTGLSQEKNVKMISIDGVAPTTETIKDGSYPLTTYLMCATLTSNQNPYVNKIIDFLLSDDGQAIIEGTGYASLGSTQPAPIIENTPKNSTLYQRYVITNAKHKGTLTVFKVNDEVRWDYWFDYFYKLDYGDFHDKGIWWIKESPDDDYMAVSFGHHYELDFDEQNSSIILKKVQWHGDKLDVQLPDKGAQLSHK
ncbi:MAG: substrate-binding domain-containing protein [Erysipelotrichaceae bacterium]|nr:substrate-binding domain-containing protein [Erysipelotrichaceae bacterium]